MQDVWDKDQNTRNEKDREKKPLPQGSCFSSLRFTDALACGHNVTAGKGGAGALTLLSMPVQSKLTGHSSSVLI